MDELMRDENGNRILVLKESRTGRAPGRPHEAAPDLFSQLAGLRLIPGFYHFASALLFRHCRVWCDDAERIRVFESLSRGPSALYIKELEVTTLKKSATGMGVSFDARSFKTLIAACGNLLNLEKLTFHYNGRFGKKAPQRRGFRKMVVAVLSEIHFPRLQFLSVHGEGLVGALNVRLLQERGRGLENSPLATNLGGLSELDLGYDPNQAGRDFSEIGAKVSGKLRKLTILGPCWPKNEIALLAGFGGSLEEVSINCMPITTDNALEFVRPHFGTLKRLHITDLHTHRAGWDTVFDTVWANAPGLRSFRWSLLVTRCARCGLPWALSRRWEIIPGARVRACWLLLIRR